MNRDNRSRENREEETSNGYGWWAGVGIAAAAGGLLWLASRSSGQEQQHQDSEESEEEQSSSSVSNYLSSLMDRASIGDVTHEAAWGIPDESIPETPYINNLDTLLHDIYIRYIALKRKEFEKHYRVFHTIFSKIHQTMKDVDPYYRQYSSTVNGIIIQVLSYGAFRTPGSNFEPRIQFAGSHFDRLRIKKPDEFDVDIFIGLPLNIRPNKYDPNKSDIILENISAGYVKLKMGTQFQNMPFRDNWETNKIMFKWRDSEFYLLRSKFSDWFKSLVYRALNQFERSRNGLPMYYVDGIPYEIGNSKAGPAATLKIKCLISSFKVDVDLVPVLKFPEDRWPVENGYREIPHRYRHEKFMVVPKPIKTEHQSDETNPWSRSWRMSLIYQENNMLYKTEHLRQAGRFMKKLRDTFGMPYLASYYVKTLFFWEVWEQEEPGFWTQSPAKLFTLMVTRLHAALSRRSVPYFWNDEYNLIQGAAANIVAGDVAKLAKLKQILNNPSEYKKVAEYLLTPSEYKEYSRFL